MGTTEAAWETRELPGGFSLGSLVCLTKAAWWRAVWDASHSCWESSFPQSPTPAARSLHFPGKHWQSQLVDITFHKLTGQKTRCKLPSVLRVLHILVTRLWHVGDSKWWLVIVWLVLQGLPLAAVPWIAGSCQVKGCRIVVSTTKW